MKAVECVACCRDKSEICFSYHTSRTEHTCYTRAEEGTEAESLHTVATRKTRAAPGTSCPASSEDEKPQTETFGSIYNQAAQPRRDESPLLQWLPAQALHDPFLRGAVRLENREIEAKRVK